MQYDFNIISSEFTDKNISTLLLFCCDVDKTQLQPPGSAVSDCSTTRSESDTTAGVSELFNNC